MAVRFDAPAPWMAALALAFMSACASQNHILSHRGNQTLRLVNATATPLCEVHVASRERNLWGPSWIEQPVNPGHHVDLRVRPDDYMLRVGRCDGATALVAYHVAVDDDLAMVIHDGYPETTDRATMSVVEYPSWSMDVRSRRGRMVAPDATADGIEMRVASRCTRDVRVVLGGDPSARSGSPSTLPASAALTYFAAEGTPLWLVDESYAVLASTTFSASSRGVTVAPSCDTFASG